MFVLSEECRRQEEEMNGMEVLISQDLTAIETLEIPYTVDPYSSSKHGLRHHVATKNGELSSVLAV